MAFEDTRQPSSSTPQPTQTKWIHQPWAAPAAVLEDARIRLGETYPEPLVDLAQSRRHALAVWDDVKHMKT
jgi:deoxyribodipyrimidine photo-lyase